MNNSGSVPRIKRLVFTDRHYCLFINHVILDKLFNIFASVPIELGCVTLLVLGCVHQPGSSQSSVLWGSFVEASSHRHDLSLTPFEAPLSSL